MGKHSPGPWEYRPAKNASSGAGMVHSADGEEVTVGHCGCCFPGDEHCSTADGHLIAAAPEMLELLRQFADLGCGCTLEHCRFSKARTLLARIDGET